VEVFYRPSLGSAQTALGTLHYRTKSSREYSTLKVPMEGRFAGVQGLLLGDWGSLGRRVFRSVDANWPSTNGPGNEGALSHATAYPEGCFPEIACPFPRGLV
jgi:hypothetical protein